MAWNGFIFGVEATGVGAALGLIGKGGKAAVATSNVAASGLRPMVSGMASAAKAKAVEAVTAAKSTVSDAVGAVGNKLDGLGERLAGVFGGGAKKVDEISLEAIGTGFRRIPGKIFGPERLEKLSKYLEKRGFELRLDGDDFLPDQVAAGFDAVNKRIYFRHNPTEAEVWHELSHFLHYQQLGPAVEKGTFWFVCLQQ